MKRLLKQVTFTVISLSIATVTASAQFKIHSDGKMSFQKTGSSAPYCPISLKSGGTDYDTPFFISYRGTKNGIVSETSYAQAREDETVGYGGLFSCNGNSVATLVGLKGYGGVPAVNFSASEPGCIGLWGDCMPSYVNRYGFGVAGTLSGFNNGAGVFGTSGYWVFSNGIPDDKYAGLFVGKTKVVGNLTVTGSVFTTLLNNSPIASDYSGQLRTLENETVTERMRSLSTLVYRHPQEETSERIQFNFMKPDKVKLEEMEKLGIDLDELDN